MTIDEKLAQLRNIVRKMKKVMVAFSGGVDSTLLLKIAKEELKDNVLAVTALSSTTAQVEREDAITIAKAFDVTHITVESQEMNLPEFVSNPENKCYFCKRHRFESLFKLAKQKGIPFVLDGENLDDHKDFRPGRIATKELGVKSPLKDAGLTKADIRYLSKRLNLPTWQKPSYACLASRIPYHSPITQEKLLQVDQAESFIRALDLSQQVRVRHYDDTARIEIPEEDIPNFLIKDMRIKIVSYLKELGFRFVTLDLEGYRMGSLNPKESQINQ